MVPEAPLESSEGGLKPAGEGWFVLNARDARWRAADGRGSVGYFDGVPEFAQVGLNLFVLGPAEPMSMYHWEADQEDFLVVSGEAVLVVEGEERPLRAWDFVHCPPRTKHTIVGAGEGGCVVIAVGARVDSVDNPDWGGFTVDDVARRHGAGVEQETTIPDEAYAAVRARYGAREPTRYTPGLAPLASRR